MTASLTQLTGGKFQDSEGNVLANGYLKMSLSQDCTVPGVGNICSGVELTVQLDANGNVVTSPAQRVWGNDNLLPTNTYYTVTGFTASGQPVWGPNIQQVMGASPFDCSTWIPGQVIRWTPSVQALGVQVNGVNVVDPSVVNFTDTASTKWSNPSAGVLEVTASGGVTTGGFFWSGKSLASAVAAGGQFPNTFANQISFWEIVLETSFSISKARLEMTGGSAGFAGTGLYSIDGTTLLAAFNSFDTSSITSPGIQTKSITPVLLAPGAYLLAAGATIAAPPVVFSFTLSSTPHAPELLNATTGGIVRVGDASNLISPTGVMPPSLGTLTPAPGSSLVYASFPAIIFSES